MRARTLLLSGLIATPALATPTDAPPARGRWSVGLALRPELAAGGAGVGTQTSFRFRFTPAWSFDMVGRSLYSTGFEGEDDELYLALGAGVGFEGGAALDAWSPRAALRFTHVHHAPLESWGDTPFSNVAGDSSGGVRHRSGAEAAVGLVAPSITDLWGQALRWELELSGGVLPSSSHFAWTTALVVGLSLDSVQ
ncbi:MAG: hypothetical protein H6706_14225 [Myxococcales bacterium]|nr:hypothetical protein [Myxococcales bacterium]